jgi:hypothetical protein
LTLHECGRATPALGRSRITVGARLLRDGNLIANGGTADIARWTQSVAPDPTTDIRGIQELFDLTYRRRLPCAEFPQLQCRILIPLGAAMKRRDSSSEALLWQSCRRRCSPAPTLRFLHHPRYRNQRYEPCTDDLPTNSAARSTPKTQLTTWKNVTQPRPSIRRQPS